MGIPINPDKKNKNCREKKSNRINLKADATKAGTKSEEANDSNTVFSDITFTVTAAPAQVQAHSTSDTLDIPEDLLIKESFLP